MSSPGNATAGAVPSSRARGRAGAVSWWSSLPPLLIAIAFVPMLMLHARMLWARPHYQLFPLVIPGAAALVYRYCRGLGAVDPGARPTAAATAAMGWALLAFSVVFVSPPVGVIGGLVTLMAAVYAVGGKRLAVAALPAWVFLWMAVPLPRSYDLTLVTSLQDLVSRWSSSFLDFFRVFHVMEGNVVEVARKRLLVDQACSGIYSLLTLSMGALFYALWTRTSVLRGLALMAAAVFWVLFGNVTRVVSIGLLYSRWGIDASGGKKHEALGILIFLLMLAMVASTDRLYVFLATVVRRIWRLARSRRGADRPARGGARVKKSAESAAAAAALGDLPPAPASPVRPPRTVLPPVGRTWLGSGLAGLAFGVLLIPQFFMPGVDWRELVSTHDVYSKSFAKLEAGTLPARWQSFEQVGYHVEHRKMDDSWGENSCVWLYHQGPRGVFLSADHEFVDWHELSVCYTSQGWDVTGRRLMAPDETGLKSLVVVDMINPQGWYGFLVYGLYKSDGAPVSPPEATGYIQSLAGRLMGWFRRGTRNDPAVARLNHQIQLFVESESPLSPSDRDAVLGFYDYCRGEIQKVGLAEVTR
jgi:exosortase